MTQEYRKMDARLKWSRRHINQFALKLRRFIENRPYDVVIEQHAQPTGQILRWKMTPGMPEAYA